jgi:hypothetical protein
MGPVRAKFRCLEINHKWDGTRIVKLSPVMQRGEHSEENRRFWEASPNGDCELVYHVDHPIELGAYYYIDMIPTSDGDWNLSTLSKWSTGGEVSLSHYRNYDYRNKPKGLLSGHLKIGIDGTKTEALESFGEPTDDNRWKVEFRYAEPSDDE